MCGIVGYVGHRSAGPILVEGLKRLEYRGYDSAGIALAGWLGIACVRAVGRIARLEEKLNGEPPDGTTGIAHTRWSFTTASSRTTAG